MLNSTHHTAKYVLVSQPPKQKGFTYFTDPVCPRVPIPQPFVYFPESALKTIGIALLLL